jgi:predicted DNA-binding WGR domain protein
MNTYTRHFEFKDEKSSKFWEVTQTDESVTVRYGKTSTAGQSQAKALVDAAAATKHVQKLIAEKLGKGYVEREYAPTTGVEAPVTPVTPKAPATKEAKRELETEPQKVPTKVAKVQPAKSPKPKSPAQDPEATPESLLAFLEKGDATNRLLARHPRASAELLEKLSHSSDKATRQAVAGNPNTPPETFVRLGQQFPKEFLTNPALDLLLMVNPALMDEVPDSLLIRLLKQADCPVSLLIWASGNAQAKVQLAVAMNAKAPDQALKKLQTSTHSAVLEAVKTSSLVELGDDPERAFEQAVRERIGSLERYDLEQAWQVDIGLAQWSALPLTFRLHRAVGGYWKGESEAVARWMSVLGLSPAEVNSCLQGFQGWVGVTQSTHTGLPMLEAIAKDSRAQVRSAVAASPHASMALLRALAEDGDHDVRSKVARNSYSPAVLLNELAADGHADVRAFVAANRSAPTDALELLGGDRDSEVRCKVALNARTPVHVLEVLAKDSTSAVREMVAKNINAPPSILNEFVQDRSKSVREALAKNPSTPSSTLLTLVIDSQVSLRIAVGQNPSCPASAFEILANDSNLQVRDKIAQNPAAPAHVLEALINTDGRSVLWELAGNPATPAKALELLSRKNDPWIQSKVAWHPSLPEGRRSEVLEELSKLPAETDRGGVAKNPMTSSGVLEILSRDKKIGVRRAVAFNPNCSAEILGHLSRDGCDVQEAVAFNLNTPLDMLVQLSQSEFPSVRRAVAVHAHRSAEIRRRLGADPDENIREKVASCPDLTAEMLDELLQGFHLERDLMALFVHPNLGHANAHAIANKLFNTPAEQSPWFLQELSRAEENVRTAVKAGRVLAYVGKDPNREVLAKRPLAAIMALCSGPHIEASRIAKVAGSTDWLIRAAVARNPGTPTSLLKKLSSDAHPLVAALASKSLESDKTSKPQGKVECAPSDSIDLVRVELEILRRMRAEGFEWTCTPIVNSMAWRDRADLNEVLNLLKRLEDFDDLVARFLAELDVSQRDLFWQWAPSAKDDELRIRLVQLSDVPPHALVRFSSDESVGVLFALAVNPALPKDLQSKVEKAAARAIKKGGQSFKERNAAAAPLAVRKHLVASNDWWIKRGLEGRAAQHPDWMTLSIRFPSNEAAKAAFDEPHLASEDAVEQGFLDEVRGHRALERLSQLRHAFQKEIVKSESSVPDTPTPVTTSAVLSAATWLDYVPISDRVAPSKSARSTDWLTRLAAALHPGATDAILKLLSEDADPDVTAAARIRLNDSERSAE